MADEAGSMAGVIPHLTIGEGKATQAIDFYTRAFGAEELRRHMADDGTRVMHCALTINGGSVMLNDDFPEWTGGIGAPAAVTLHLQVDDADRWFARATEAGATVSMPLADQFWGDRYGQVTDPFGHRWSIGAPVAGQSE